MRAIFLKLSGERLAGQGEIWHIDSLARTAQKIADAYNRRQELAVGGLTLVVGAGNIARGENLRHIFGRQADFIGRLGIVKNTVALSLALDRLKVPNAMFLTDKMTIKDPSMELDSYAPELVKAAHKLNQVVLIAGGIGEDNQTTDSAVVFYARDYESVSSDGIEILKGTQVSGVYDKDPKKHALIKRYLRIGAKQMLANYDSFKVVDRMSLERLAAAPHLTMFVYKEDEHDLVDVLRHEPHKATAADGIGTVIVADLPEPVFY